MRLGLAVLRDPDQSAIQLLIDTSFLFLNFSIGISEVPNKAYTEITMKNYFILCGRCNDRVSKLKSLSQRDNRVHFIHVKKNANFF